MRHLFEVDLKDYDGCTKVFRRPSARAIIFKGDKLALVYAANEKYFKFPGGGIHDDEDKKAALVREVKEEAGLAVIPSSIKEYGSVLRRQKSEINEDTVFEQENYYYFCKTEDVVGSQNLDNYEKEAGFMLVYADIDEAIKVNSEYKSNTSFNEVMIKRENRVLELIKAEMTDILKLYNNKLLETERLLITELNTDMAADVHENSLDEDTRRFVPDEVFETPEDAKETIEFLTSCYGSENGPLVYAVILKDGNINMGYVQLVPIGEGKWEIGYHVAKPYTCKGYATEAVNAFLPVMAEKLGINEVYGIRLLENTASGRVLEKCGFNTFFVGKGKYHDGVYEISKSVRKL